MWFQFKSPDVARAAFKLNQVKLRALGMEGLRIRRVLSVIASPVLDLSSNFIAALGSPSRPHMAGIMAFIGRNGVAESQFSSGISPCATFLYPRTFPSSLWSRMYVIFHRYSTPCLKPMVVQIVGNDTSALSSVLKADVW